jgi:hypothetical protein
LFQCCPGSNCYFGVDGGSGSAFADTVASNLSAGVIRSLSVGIKQVVVWGVFICVNCYKLP